MTRMRSESESTSSSSSEIEQDRAALVALLDEPAVQVLDRADVEAAGRLGGDRAPSGRARSRARRRPSAGCRRRAAAGGRLRAAAADVELPDQRCARARRGGAGRASRSASPARLVVVVQRDVLGDRELQHEPAALPVLGDVADPGVEHAARARVRRPPRRRRRPRRSRCPRRPVIASISSLWPLPSTPAMPTISPARTAKRDVAYRRQAAVVVARAGRAPRAARRRHRRAFLSTRSSTSRPTIIFASASSVAPSRGTVSIFLPRRSTVIRSAISSTSFSLWLMKMIDVPLRLEALDDREQLARLLRRQHRGRLVEDQDARRRGRAPSGSRRAAAGRR